jgi:hypothetical protein
MAEVIYLLGAGFNYGVVDLGRGRRPPLARNFFQVLLQDGSLEQRLEAIRRNIYVDVLLGEIRRYWHFDLSTLKTEPFDIEECLTLFESQILDESDPDRSLALRRATFALRNLMLMYLGELSFDGFTPTARQFGAEVLAAQADVLTFNYDTLAEEAIGFASGIGNKPVPTTRRQEPSLMQVTSDDDLDASHLSWKRPLAYGFEFQEVTLPVSGVSEYISCFGVMRRSPGG